MSTPAYNQGFQAKLAALLHGKAKKEDVKPGDVSQKQLQKGIKVEKEHTGKPEVAKTIATDHLTEIPDYYTRLHHMETQAKNAGHMSNNFIQGEAEHDKETKDKPAKKMLDADSVRPRGEGPWTTEGQPEFVGESYKDLSAAGHSTMKAKKEDKEAQVKRAYLTGFANRCNSHGVTPEQLFQVATKLSESEFTPASPAPCAFRKQEAFPKNTKAEQQKQDENGDKKDPRGSRHQQQTDKRENGPDIIKARVAGGGLVRSDA